MLRPALLAVATWGTTPIATKIAVADHEPITVGVLRILLAASPTRRRSVMCRLRLARRGEQGSASGSEAVW